MEGSGRVLLDEGALEAAIQAVELLTQQNGALFHDLAMLRDTIAYNDDSILDPPPERQWESQTSINMRLMQMPTGHAADLRRMLEAEKRAILVGAPYDFDESVRPITAKAMVMRVSLFGLSIINMKTRAPMPQQKPTFKKVR